MFYNILHILISLYNICIQSAWEYLPFWISQMDFCCTIYLYVVHTVVHHFSIWLHFVGFIFRSFQRTFQYIKCCTFQNENSNSNFAFLVRWVFRQICAAFSISTFSQILIHIYGTFELLLKLFFLMYFALLIRKNICSVRWII